MTYSIAGSRWAQYFPSTASLRISIEGLLGHELLQALVLLLERFELLELPIVHFVVLTLLRVVGVLAHADLLYCPGHGGTFYAESFHLAEFGNDLLWSVLLFPHHVALGQGAILTYNSDQFIGGIPGGCQRQA